MSQAVRRLPGMLIASLLLLGCATAAPPHLDDEASIRAFGERWLAAYESGDIAGLEALYESDAWVMTRDQRAKKGRAAVLEFFAARAGTGADLDMAFDYEDITIDGDYAFLVSTWRLTVTPKGVPPIKDAGRSFLVFKRGADGAWRVWRDMDNRTADMPVE